MSSIWTRIEKQFKLCFKNLGCNVIMLKNDDLLMIVEHVKNDSTSLRVYLEKASLK
jgi:hypothetical protein